MYKRQTKGHEIAKKILAKEARWQIEGQLSYRNISGSDGFHMVINANSEQDAENKAYKELDKARDRKKIGPGGGGSVEDVEIENIERTSDRLQAPSTFRVSEYNPADEVKEGKAPYRLSYDDRYGKHAGFEDAKSLADLQNKAANLRKRGFVINKMGRNTSPVKEENLKEAPDPTTYGPDKVAKAMAIAVKSDGQYSKAVREIEKIGKDLSKVSTIARALKTANEGLNERGGANTSTKQGSFAKSRKPKYRFGYRVAEKDPAKGKELEETHTTQTAKANASQRAAGGEKSPISLMKNKSIDEITKNDGKTFAQMRAEIDEACWDSHKQVGTKIKGGKRVPNCVPKNEEVKEEDKKEQEAGEDTRDKKKKTMTGQVATSPEMNPKVDYKY